MTVAAARQHLHDRCAVYTSAAVSSRLLDAIGWTPETDLSESVLLEPSVGEGAILLEAVRRLVASLRNHGHRLRRSLLLPRIVGYEFHPETAKTCRSELSKLLAKESFSAALAAELAQSWVIKSDFLLQQPGKATHVAANPPYLRWSKVPDELTRRYIKAVPPDAARGDISVAFVHKMLQWAEDKGVITALISDRWLYAQYANDFVARIKAAGWSIDVVDERPKEPFVRKVGAYSAIVLLRRNSGSKPSSKTSQRDAARKLHGELVERFGTLEAAGCRVRVGPALGAKRTFIVEAGQTADIESELLRPFVEREDLKGSEIISPRKRVIVPYDGKGKLIDVACWPRFANWARANRDVLRARSQFVGSAHYWRTIDAIPSDWSNSSKLIIPELCVAPKSVLDLSGAIPAHSLYAIWSDQWPIKVLQRVLNSGLLQLTAIAEAPRMSNGWLRFYKRFLVRAPLPCWSLLSPGEREGLLDEGAAFEATFMKLFGFVPGALNIASDIFDTVDSYIAASCQDRRAGLAPSPTD